MERSQELVTSADGARMLECTVQHLRLLVRQQKLSGTKIGRDWFVDRSSIESFLKSKYPIGPEKNDSDVVAEPGRGQLPLFEHDAASITNVASVPQRSPFRYPGGKTWLIPIARSWLSSLGHRPDLLIEPFAGGGGIGLLAAFENLAERSLLVELDPDIASVWLAMLNGLSNALREKVLAFECTPDHVGNALASAPVDILDQAFLTLLRNRVSRGGILAPGAGLVRTGEGNRGIASRWYPETLSRRIEAIHAHNSKIDFIQGDGLKVIEEYANCPNVVFFVDPPYPVAGRRLYRYHQLDHRRLFELLSRVKGAVLVTYDQNSEIQALADQFGFQWRLVPMKSTHHARKFELLISNDLSWLPQSASTCLV